MAEKYLLRVTAGPSYDPSTHQVVAVNGPTSTRISSSHCTANVNVRIQNYRGLPHGSPPTSPYFSSEAHAHDQYSIAFTMIPHKTIPGNALVFGNDFDHPVRDRLPPGFSTAFKIVKWAIDPGLDGDVYADKPHLYGPTLSSINTLRIGEKVSREGEGEEGGWKIPSYVHEDGIEEGGDGDGVDIRKEGGIPDGAAERKKWFLDEGKRQSWNWEEGRVYRGDFFNPYLDFNQFSLKLPGFSLSILSYLDKKDSLRYVMKNKDTGDVLFIVVFALIPKEEVEEEEKAAASRTLKGEVKEGNEAEKSSKGEEGFEPKADDLD